MTVSGLAIAAMTASTGSVAGAMTVAKAAIGVPDSPAAAAGCSIEGGVADNMGAGTSGIDVADSSAAEADFSFAGGTTAATAGVVPRSPAAAAGGSIAGDVSDGIATAGAEGTDLSVAVACASAPNSILADA